MTITAFDLLARGYFPKELPPPFTTQDFANRVIGVVGPLPGFFANPRKARLCTHNFARIGRLRRVLGIPNPIPQYNLSVLIAKNWPRLERLIKRSQIGASHPVAGRDRALNPGDSPVGELKAQVRANSRLLVTADIARFYHSVYTHTIAWAVHTKEVAKVKRGPKWAHLLGNRLDSGASSCQDGQTIGLPVGPDTSLVLAELVVSAVDSKLQGRIKRIRGVRFIDDYEFPCRTRREADEFLQALHIALADYELALNPLKTAIADLPLPVDQPWKTPIRTASLRKTPREQATDLIAMFDVAYSLSRQYPDKSVLAYAIGRLGDVDIRSENAELFQRLSMQCLLSEPGTSAVVLERLASHRSKGLPVHYIELAEVLNDQIIEHAPLGHANEVAWALWGMLIFDLKVTKRAAKVLSDVNDDVVALLALHSKARGLMHSALDTTLWQTYLTQDELLGEHWLLAYEASVKGWLSSASGADHIGAEAAFDWLRSIGVEFYDIDKAAAIPAPAPGAEEPEWLADLEEQLSSRRAMYGEPEVDDPDALADVGVEF